MVKRQIERVLAWLTLSDFLASSFEVFVSRLGEEKQARSRQEEEKEEDLSGS